MDLYEKLALTKKYFWEKYPGLGVNKKREAIRLSFEIAKRERLPGPYLPPAGYKNYESLKKSLLRRRYPLFGRKIPLERFYLPELELDGGTAFRADRVGINPGKIYFEKGTEDSELFGRLKRKFPSAQFRQLSGPLPVSGKRGLREYNRRSSAFFLVKERFDFIKPCPCAKGCVSCGYFIMNLGFGCPFECSYCFLQGYQNVPGLVIPSNIDDFFEEFDRKFSKLESRVRIGSGEFTDSLAMDDITGFSGKIVDFFSRKENVVFEFKTKSSNIKNLLDARPSPNVIVSFSMNPAKLVQENEFYSASFAERLQAMSLLEKRGYGVAFHLDPVIFSPVWENLYSDMLSDIFSRVPPEKIRWISLGTFRLSRETKKAIENRFPDNAILDEEMFLDFDGKLRYPYEIRLRLYSNLEKKLSSYGFDKKRLYLCMESPEMWRDLGLDPSFIW